MAPASYNPVASYLLALVNIKCGTFSVLCQISLHTELFEKEHVGPFDMTKKEHVESFCMIHGTL